MSRVSRLRHYTPPMERRTAVVLLAVFGTGVFLAGLELMITAVALPSILASLVDASGSSAWIELRKASWIINGYLLVYILTMPMAGRLTDLWGARRLLMGALVVFIVGSVLAGMAQSLDQLIAARLVQAVGGGVLVPVGTAAASHLFGGTARPRALGHHRRADVPRDGRRPVRRRGDPVVRPCRRTRSSAPGLANGPLADIAGAVVALDLLHQRPDRASSRSCWRGPSLPAGTRRVAPAASTSSGASLFGLALLTGLVGLTLIGTTEIAGTRPRSRRR